MWAHLCDPSTSPTYLCHPLCHPTDSTFLYNICGSSTCHPHPLWALPHRLPSGTPGNTTVPSAELWSLQDAVTVWLWDAGHAPSHCLIPSSPQSTASQVWMDVATLFWRAGGATGSRKGKCEPLYRVTAVFMIQEKSPRRSWALRRGPWGAKPQFPVLALVFHMHPPAKPLLCVTSPSDGAPSPSSASPRLMSGAGVPFRSNLLWLWPKAWSRRGSLIHERPHWDGTWVSSSPWAWH